MIDCIVQYKKELRKLLHCSNATKTTLLSEFDVLLCQFLIENPKPNSDEIRRAFGPPEEIAQTLMSKVSNNEKAHHQLKVKRIRICIIILFLMFVLSTIYIFFLKERPMQVYDEAYEITETCEGGK